MDLKVLSGDPLNILSSTKFVVENSTFVSINASKIKEIIPDVKKIIGDGLKDVDYNLGITGDYNEDLQLVFIQDVVNFCFWAEKGKEKWKVEYPKGKIVDGGWFALVSCFKRAREEKTPILNAEYLKEIKLKDLKHIFRSSSGVEIPIIVKRRENLNEVGEVLLKKFKGQIINMIKETGLDAVNVVKKVIEYFPSFRDVTMYKGKEINFYKRAQIVAGDISYLSEKGEQIKMKNLNELTAFADYKLPQILRNSGILVYSKKLAENVDNYKLISAGSEEEIEIRAGTVWAIELIRQQIPEYSAAEIDNAIWLISQDQSKVEKPYHRTYTTFY